MILLPFIPVIRAGQVRRASNNGNRSIIYVQICEKINKSNNLKLRRGNTANVRDIKPFRKFTNNAIIYIWNIELQECEIPSMKSYLN